LTNAFQYKRFHDEGKFSLRSSFTLRC
jgi:hypothetical protein